MNQVLAGIRLGFGEWSTSHAQRGSTLGCARRRGTDTAARLGACVVPRALRAGRPVTSRCRQVGCASCPAWQPPPRQAIFIASEILGILVAPIMRSQSADD